MGNAYFFLTVFILFPSISCFASDETTSNIPSLHDGHASTKLASITSYDTKIRANDPKEVDNGRAFRGRKMKGDYQTVMVARSLSDSEEHVKTSSTKKHYYINNVKGGDGKGDSKYEANSKSTKVTGRAIQGHNQKTTTTDMDSFVACADYPSPHHHPPKNN